MNRGLFSVGLLTGTEFGRISELRFEGGGSFKAAGQRRQSIGKEDTLTHEDFAEITCPDTKILQASQDRLCRIIGYMFNCRVNSQAKGCCFMYPDLGELLKVYDRIYR